jgi:hypothetical protein
MTEAVQIGYVGELASIDFDFRAALYIREIVKSI